MRTAPWRRISQTAGAAITNSYWFALFTGTIYQGSLKGFCVPALNCYACPLALFACPIGTIQHFFVNPAFYISLYAIGIVGIVGAAVGRMACGWLCPFGFAQDLLYKIPSRKLSLPKWASYGKYAALAILVCILPLLTKETWFCKLCPAGAAEGALPMLMLDSSLSELLGTLFALKMFILLVVILAAVSMKRPFCRMACPLGAIFSFFNRISIFRMAVDHDACIKCDLCQKECPMNLKVYENTNDADCIRCLKCQKTCKLGAVSYESLAPGNNKEAIENV